MKSAKNHPPQIETIETVDGQNPAPLEVSENHFVVRLKKDFRTPQFCQSTELLCTQWSLKTVKDRSLSGACGLLGRRIHDRTAS